MKYPSRPKTWSGGMGMTNHPAKTSFFYWQGQLYDSGRFTSASLKLLTLVQRPMTDFQNFIRFIGKSLAMGNDNDALPMFMRCSF